MANPLDFGGRIQVYTTCPQSKDSTAEQYLAKIAEAAQWSDGAAGMLIFSDNSIVDPWLVAQQVIQHSTTLLPLVAVQPLYLHPYSTAKMVASLGFMHRRPIALNMIAGGFKTDLEALCDPVTHDDRYERLVEYCQVMQRLFQGDLVTEQGTYYQVHRLRLSPALPANLRPRFLMSGSSPAGRNAARRINAVSIEYPEPRNVAPPAWTGERGIRIGIIARDNVADARAVASDRFPPNRRGQLARQMATKLSDSAWHHQLAKAPEQSETYSLWPFQNDYSSCPYLIGSYETVALELSLYLLQYSTFILDIPRQMQDVIDASIAFHAALKMVHG